MERMNDAAATQEIETNGPPRQLLVQRLLDGEPRNSMLRKVALRLENAAGRPLVANDVLGVEPTSIQSLKGVGKKYVQYFEKPAGLFAGAAGRERAPL